MFNARTLFLSLLTLTAVEAQAHRAWIQPALTVLSGEKAVVSFDAAVSNTIFIADHAALRSNGLNVTAPDGSVREVENLHTGKNRTVFDVTLDQQGTYRIGMASSGLSARWETEDGKRAFWPPRGEKADPAEFSKKVPADAKNLSVSYNSRRMETFVTAGVPTDGIFTPSNKGLEMIPVTHPNDLFAGEAATLRFLMDGEAVEGVEVTLIREGTRYRNSEDAIELHTNKQGEVVINWQGAGRYFVEASYRDNKAQAPATQRSGGYTAVLEVLPD
ncbi:DUF4198 domain-containing protein [Thalassolituus marinus]|uniref:DUF4198 domain-containing protein n=1 Tax=Thalassolituus marinus TaxID=671053 RepID=A0ABS7ZPN8_9GAMM|nr:DUF4198 domain-containing protein [Thalassolituus marinus]MCA6063666.1 DUF4198 domain-containing protein [Thalassolituus marinus]